MNRKTHSACTPSPHALINIVFKFSKLNLQFCFSKRQKQFRLFLQKKKIHENCVSVFIGFHVKYNFYNWKRK